MRFVHPVGILKRYSLFAVNGVILSTQPQGRVRKLSDPFIPLIINPTRIPPHLWRANPTPRLAAMPPQTDHLYVVDVRHVLRGIVPVPVLLVSEPATLITDLMREEVVTFNPTDDAKSAVGVFERYDLVSAPVSPSMP